MDCAGPSVQDPEGSNVEEERLGQNHAGLHLNRKDSPDSSFKMFKYIYTHNKQIQAKRRVSQLCPLKRPKCSDIPADEDAWHSGLLSEYGPL